MASYKDKWLQKNGSNSEYKSEASVKNSRKYKNIQSAKDFKERWMKENGYSFSNRSEDYVNTINSSIDRLKSRNGEMEGNRNLSFQNDIFQNDAVDELKKRQQNVNYWNYLGQTGRRPFNYFSDYLIPMTAKADQQKEQPSNPLLRNSGVKIQNKVGNVDINNRPVIHNDDKSYSTTSTAYQERWKGDEETGHYDIGHFATIKNDGTRLSDKEMNDYIDYVMGSDDPYKADREKYNLLYGIVDKLNNGETINDSNIKQAMKEAEEWDVNMHNTQDDMYKNKIVSQKAWESMQNYQNKGEKLNNLTAEDWYKVDKDLGIKNALSKVWDKNSPEAVTTQLLRPFLKDTNYRGNPYERQEFQPTENAADRLKYASLARQDENNPLNKALEEAKKYNYGDNTVIPEALRLYTSMTPMERQRYNEIYGEYGRERAEEFKNSLTDSLNYRMARENYNNNTLIDNPVGRVAGQFGSGVQSFAEGINNVVPWALGAPQKKANTVNQYESMVMKENSSGAVENVAQDLANSAGMNLSSSLIGQLAGSNTIGSLLFGLSAGGNAYQEALNDGNSVAASSVFGAQQAGDEFITNYFLDGVAGMSSGTLRKLLGNTRIANAAYQGIMKFAKTPANQTILKRGLEFGLSVGGEFLQEFIQNYTEKITRNLVMGEDNEITLSDPDAWYSAALGALNAIFLNTSTAPIRAYSNNLNLKEIEKTYDNSAAMYKDIRDNVEPGLLKDLAGQFADKIDNGGKINALERNLFATEMDNYLNEYNEDAEDILRPMSESETLTDDNSVNPGETVIEAEHDSLSQEIPGTVEENTTVQSEKAEIVNAAVDELQRQQQEEIPDTSESNPEEAKIQTETLVNAIQEEDTPEIEFNSKKLDKNSIELDNNSIDNVSQETEFKDELQKPKAEISEAENDVLGSEIAENLRNNTQNGENRTETGNRFTGPVTSDAINAAMDEYLRANNVVDDDLINFRNSFSSIYGKSGQNTFNKLVRANENLRDDADTFSRLYNAGRYGLKFAEAGDYSKFGKPLSYAAYDSGVQDRTNEFAALAKSVDRLRKNPKAVKSGVYISTTKATDGDLDKVLSGFTRTVPFSVIVVDSRDRMTLVSAMSNLKKHGLMDMQSTVEDLFKKPASGASDPGRGFVVLDLNSTNIFNTLTHELTHVGKVYNPKGYRAFADAVLNKLSKMDKRVYNLENELAEKMDKYKQTVGQELSRELAEEEIVAEASGLLTDREIIEAVISKDKSFAEKIRDWLKDIAKILRKLIDSRTLKKEAKVLLNADLKFCEEAAGLWTEMLEGAADNYNKALEPSEALKADAEKTNDGTDRKAEQDVLLEEKPEIRFQINHIEDYFDSEKIPENLRGAIVDDDVRFLRKGIRHLDSLVLSAVKKDLYRPGNYTAFDATNEYYFYFDGDGDPTHYRVKSISNADSEDGETYVETNRQRFNGRNDEVGYADRLYSDGVRGTVQRREGRNDSVYSGKETDYTGNIKEDEQNEGRSGELSVVYEGFEKIRNRLDQIAPYAELNFTGDYFEFKDEGFTKTFKTLKDFKAYLKKNYKEEIDDLGGWDNIRYQLNIPSDMFYDPDAEDERLKTANAYLTNMLQASKNLKPSEKDIKKVVKDITDVYNSGMDRKELTRQLTELYTYMRTNEHVDGAQVSETINAIARQVIREAKYADPQQQEMYTKFRKALKDTTVYVDKSYVNDIEPEGWNTLRKKYFGRVKLTANPEMSSHDGIRTYLQLQQEFPEIYRTSVDDIMTDADAVREILYGFETARPKERSLFGEASTEAEAAEELATRIMDAYFEVGNESVKNEYLKTYKQVREDIKEEIIREYNNSLKSIQINDAKKLSTLVKNYKAGEITADSLFVTKEALTDYTRQQNEAARELYINKRDKYVDRIQRNKYKDDIIKTSKELAKMILSPTDKKHIPTDMVGPISNVLQYIDFSSNRVNPDGSLPKRTVEADEFHKSITGIIGILNKLDKNNSVYENNGETSYLVIDPDLMQNLREVSEAFTGNDEVKDNVDNLSTQNLRTVAQTLKALKQMVNNANKFINTGRYETVSELAKQSIDDFNLYANRRSASKLATKAKEIAQNKYIGMLDDLLNSGMLDAYTFFDSWGDTGHVLYDNVRAGLDRKIRNTRTAVDFMEESMKRNDVSVKERNRWDNDLIEVELNAQDEPREIKVNMTAAQIMSLYLLNKRGQARMHLYGDHMSHNKQNGGFILEASGRNKSKIDTTHVFKVTEQDVDNLISKLTPKQKAVADDIGRFLTEVTSKWGNEVTQRLYGYNKFEAKNYFPIKVDNTTIGKTSQSLEKGMTMLKNIGQTKSVQQRAYNPLTLQNIFDVYAAQADDMGSYNAFVTSSADLQMWLNYKGDEGNVQRALKNAYGDKANEYFMNILRDINGSRGDPSKWDKAIGSLVGLSRGGAIWGNLRVAVQQPFAYIRAVDTMKTKYLLEGLTLSPAKQAEEWELAKEYAPIAQWKDYGFFDIGVGPSMKRLILGNDTFKDKVQEAGMWGASTGDMLAWVRLWYASQAEVKDTHPELTPGTKEFYEEAGKVFSHVIDTTQVVDSVLHRTDIMKDKTTSVKSAAAFLSEPSKTYNMLYRALRDFSNASTGEKMAAAKRVGATVSVWLVSQAVNSAVASMVSAIRYHDKDKDLLEKYKEKFIADYLDALQFWNSIPLIKQWTAALSGGEQDTDATYSLLSLIPTMFDMMMKAKDGKQKMGWWQMLYRTSQLTTFWGGNNLQNPLRDIDGIIDNLIIRDDMGMYYPYQQAKYDMYAQQDNGSYPNLSRFVSTAMKAYAQGDSELGDKIIADLKAEIPEDKVVNQITSRLAKEPELEELAQATLDGETATAETLTASLRSKGYPEELIEKKVGTLVKGMKPSGDSMARAFVEKSDGWQDQLRKYENYYSRQIKSDPKKSEDEKTDEKIEAQVRSTLKKNVTDTYADEYRSLDGKGQMDLQKKLLSLQYKGQPLYKEGDFTKKNSTWKK